MNPSFKRNLRRVISTAFAIFIALFIGRLIYGYYYPGKTYDSSSDYSADESSYTRKNYASEKTQSKLESKAVDVQNAPMEPSPGRQSQKYEKVATVKSKTNKFEEDEKAIKTKIKSFGGIIQYEHNRGNKGDRTLSLTIGISPEKFDSFYVTLLKIGRIVSRQVSKTDMTNEYLQLNAKKTSLEKVRNSLLELKSRPGKIDEYMQLENRILEIEEQLQDLGVELGNFDEENEYCTVRFYLVEGKAERTISVMQRLKVAFEWTIKYTLALYGIITCILLGSYLLLLVIEKLRVLIGRLNMFKDSSTKH